MLEAEIERKEYDERYIFVVDQNKKQLETSSIEISKLRIENEKQKEQIQGLNKEVEKTTLLKLQVEEAEKRRKILLKTKKNLMQPMMRSTNSRDHKKNTYKIRHMKKQK